jgi:hypothetical protein
MDTSAKLTEKGFPGLRAIKRFRAGQVFCGVSRPLLRGLQSLWIAGSNQIKSNQILFTK